MRRTLLQCFVIACVLVPATAQAEDPLVFQFSFGSRPTDLGQGRLVGPSGITTDSEGYVYVTDNALVKKYSPSGVFLSAFGGSGTGDGQFLGLDDVAIDASGTIYTTENQGARIQVFNSAGTYLRQWPAIGSFSCAIDPTGAYLATAAGGSGRVFRTSDGVLVAGFTFSAFFNSFEGCLGIGPSGTVYIAPRDEEIVRKYSILGAFQGEWGSTGPAQGQFETTGGMTVDSHERAYVADGRSGIMVFESDGTFVSRFSGFGNAVDQIAVYRDMAVDNSGNCYILDSNRRTVLKFGNLATTAMKSSWGSLKRRYR